MQYTELFETNLNQNISFFRNIKNNFKKDLRDFFEIKITNTLEEKIKSLFETENNIDQIILKIKTLKNHKTREDMVLEICNSFLKGQFKIEKDIKKIELCVKICVAILTDGVVSAPVEGIYKINERLIEDSDTIQDLSTIENEKKYIEIYYAGPIRGAGGTAQVYSILTAEYMARNLKYNKYIATNEEIERYIGEILKYMKIYPRIRIPSVEEIKLVVSQIFICISGVGTEVVEVDSYKYLPRVKTPNIRGGMCLIIVDGVILKHAKLLKASSYFKLDWSWLKNLKNNSIEQEDVEKKFLQTLSIGKPILSISSQIHGFRLRLGRSRNTGLGTGGLNPFTLKILKFLNVGTQLIVEYPGKALGIAPVSDLEPCKVKLKNNSFISINSEETYLKYQHEIVEIVDLGEILISFGDFIESNYPIPKLDWCTELYKIQLKKIPDIDIKKYLDSNNVLEIYELCQKYSLIIHPFLHPLIDYITYKEYIFCRENIFKKITDSVILIIETLGIEYEFINNTYLFKNEIIVNWFFLKDKQIDYKKYATIYDLINNNSNIKISKKGNNVIDCRTGRVEGATETHTKPSLNGIYEINHAGFSTNILNKLLDKNTILNLKLRSRFCKICYNITYKAYCCEHTAYLSKKSELNEINYVNSNEKEDYIKYFEFIKKNYYKKLNDFMLPQELFGGLFNYENIEFFKNEVKNFITLTVDINTLDLNVLKNYYKTIKYALNKIYILDPNETNFKVNLFEVPVTADFKKACKNLKLVTIPPRIKVSNKTITGLYELEPFEKIILRSKYELSSWKDGTIRYTFSNLSLTHFTAKEIHTSITKLQELGYTEDIFKQPLINENQIIELKPLDILINYNSLNYFYKITKYIDDLLVSFYKEKTFYNLNKATDLLGHYFIGLSPHTCVGVCCRVIGYTLTNVLYAHPIFHSAKRRNCDGDGDNLMLLGDCLLNFSHAYDRHGNGAKMNIPISICTTVLISEIDKEARNLDIYNEYPLQIYEEGIAFKNSFTLGKKEDKDLNNLNIGFTTQTNTIQLDTIYNAYKDINNTKDKLYKQFETCKLLRNLKKQTIFYEKVLKTHLLPDIIGNIKSYLKQSFRCNKCKIVYRTITYTGLCYTCKNELKQTVHEKSVKKYLQHIDYIFSVFKLDEFTQQKVQLVRLELKELFETNISENSKNENMPKGLLQFKK